jgi:Holliday junction resolvase
MPFKNAILSLFLLAFSALHVAAQEVDARKEALLVRALNAMAFVPGFKQSLLVEKQSSGKTTRFMDATLAADDAQVERIIARVYAKYLSQQQVEELLRFYESAAGKALLAQQGRDPNARSRVMTLDPAHAAEARAFTSSPAGRTFARISDSQEIWGEIAEALRRALPKR